MRPELWCFGSYADIGTYLLITYLCRELHLHESHFNKKPYFYHYYLPYKVSICVNVWILGKLGFVTVIKVMPAYLVGIGLTLSQPVHRGAFCQFPFRCIYYCHTPLERKLAKCTSVRWGAHYAYHWIFIPCDDPA